MRMLYRDGTEDDDELFDLLLECQRYYVARCIQFGPNWIKEPMCKQMIDTLLSIRRNDGKQSFYREIAWADKNSLSQAYVSDTLNGRREPGPKILRALGLVLEPNYRKVKS